VISGQPDLSSRGADRSAVWVPDSQAQRRSLFAR